MTETVETIRAWPEFVDLVHELKPGLRTIQL